MGLRLGEMRPSWAALPIELVAGVIFFAHGLPKFSDPAGFAERAMGGIPLFLSYLVIAAELGGGLSLLAGLLVRFSALGQLCVMAVAVVEVHWATGLTGRGGFEFPLVLLATSLALLILGPDPLSIDDKLRPLLYRSGKVALRREDIDITNMKVKLAAILLILAGIGLPFARSYVGIPEGIAPLVMAAVAGLLSAASGAALAGGKPWAYLPAFVMARLYLAASTLMLFWIKYAVRGLVAMTVSLIILAALSSAQRRTQ
ncbi:MAG: DoxX family protein [Blastocatellia bacterium]|nr:DoxX family protein [Blastocatellia bacterium]